MTLRVTDDPVPESDHAWLRGLIAEAARHLPPQGPIGVFIAQNPLQAFESQPFERAVVGASRMLDAQPFLSESRYREELARGRITEADIDAVLDEEHRDSCDEASLASGRVSLQELHRTLLLHPIVHETDATVRWTLSESGAIDRLRDDLPARQLWRLVAEAERADAASGDEALRAAVARMASIGHHDEAKRASGELWYACVEAIARFGPASAPGTRPPVRPRDLVRDADPRVDTDELVHPKLVRWCASFLDQGVAGWPMPGREEGLLAAVAGLHDGRVAAAEEWSRGLAEALRATRSLEAIEVVRRELVAIGVPRNAWPEFVTRTLLALRGWAGMIHQLERRPDMQPVTNVPARIVDFLALRLVCDRVATEWAAARLGFWRSRGPWRAPDRQGRTLGQFWVELCDRFQATAVPGSLCRAFRLHQVSQLVGLDAGAVRSLDENELFRFERAIVTFDGVTRRRLLHRAYERHFRVQTLDAFAAHAREVEPVDGDRPLLQAVFCMDERCESFRRHLEELGPACETFGTAGFFAVPMRYRGIDDWHASPRCPIVVQPSHGVVEVPRERTGGRHRLRRRLRRQAVRLAAELSVGSRSLLRGGLLTAIGGALAAVPLVARVAFPRLAAAFGRRARGLGGGGATRLELERLDDTPLADGTLVGFSVDEMAAIVQRVLEDVGLTEGQARVVAIVGHGSSSLNNPHESAYECGACGGRPGGANARAFAGMANDPRVRAALSSRGVRLPPDTLFVGGQLDTCSDRVEWFDLDGLPDGHREDVRRLRDVFEHASRADAHERCRRFESAPLESTMEEALRHVEARAVDLAQVRPELGHATNAVCVVGRRRRTRGLFLDRRAFLVSYDASRDADDSILERTLAAVGPVASGISLAYFFSAVDRIRHGCGTKLPHNLTGLLGVMDGHASDLRTGLPWQTVEMHEPLRLLLVVESTPDRILSAASRLPGVDALFRNEWVQLAAWNPEDGRLDLFQGGRFLPYVPERMEIPVVDRSSSWYAGKRGHLAPARVLAAMAGAGRAVIRSRTRAARPVGV